MLNSIHSGAACKKIGECDSIWRRSIRYSLQSKWNQSRNFLDYRWVEKDLCSKHLFYWVFFLIIGSFGIFKDLENKKEYNRSRVIFSKDDNGIKDAKLTIEQAEYSDRGWYNCTVRNKATNSSHYDEPSAVAFVRVKGNLKFSSENLFSSQKVL